jgi:TolA-binding protein
VERVAGQIPEEVNAYREMQDRFSTRTDEFRMDVKRFFAIRKAEEMEKVSKGYDALIQTLEAAERSQRNATIEKLTIFLDRYPTARDSDNIRFRLAELLYEKAIEQWLESQAGLAVEEEKYDTLLEEAEKALETGDSSLMETLPEPPEPPKKDLADPIRLYQEIIAHNDVFPTEEKWEHLDRVFYSLGFSYHDTEVKQHDFDEAEDAFSRLVTEAPQSDLADAAHMFLGNLLFTEKKDFDGAIAQYKSVISKGKDGQYYFDATFQLGWTYYKLAGKDQTYESKALQLFTHLLDDSDRSYLESGRESDFAPDARKNMARTIADVADRSENSPVLVAKGFFGEIGERKWERDVFIALAEVLGGCVPVPNPCPAGQTGRGRYEIESAIEVYENLQRDPRWVTESDNPQFQRKIIWLLPYKLEPNLELDLPEEQKKLVERYGEEIIDPVSGENIPNPWWLANRNNPDALDQVRQFIEGSLADVAVGLMREAQAKNDPNLYRSASLKFRDYLDKFPIADNFFDHQWYLANALMLASPSDVTRPWGSYQEALTEFESLIKSKDGHPYGDGALFQRMVSIREILLAKQDEHGRLDELPRSAVVEKTLTTEFGKEVTTYLLSDDHKALVEAMNDVLNHKFGPPQGEGLPDYRQVLAKNKAYLLYTPGLVLFYHNRYEEARKQLMLLFDDPELVRTKEASFAAKLIVDSFTLEGDLGSVRQYTTKFLRLPLPSETIEQFDIQNKQSAFLQAQAYIEQGDRDKAAEAFEGYMAEFPDTSQENYRYALYNAANSYEIVGKAEKANRLFERYVELYPSDDVSKKLYTRIAGNYESVFDLERAIYYYKRLIENDPGREYPGTADAQYNLAFLKIGLGKHREAAKGFERYADLFPEQADAEDVHFRAGEQWEEVSSSEALRFYERYQRKYGMQNPDHVIAARYRIAQIYKDQGKASAYRKAMDSVLTTFDSVVATGGKLRATSRHYAAERAFEILAAEYDSFAQGEMVGIEAKDVALLEKKDAEIGAFEEKALALINKYSDFEYGMGSYYLMASARLFIAELGYAMECPRKYNEEECDIWYEVFEEDSLPQFDEFQDRAVERFTNLISGAKKQNRHTEWVDKAYTTLNRLDPFSYPAQKSEIRGDSSAESYPKVAPMSIDIEAESGK